MPLPILASLVTRYYPSRYIVHIALSIIAVLALRAYSIGRSTNRERDLHGRVVLLTGSFTPLGSTLLEALARRGAHVIALTNLSVDAPEVTLIIEALRETTKNEKIFVEQCDTNSIESSRNFCNKFLTGKEHRLDAIIFAHEYSHIGPFFGRLSQEEREEYEKERSLSSNCTFLMTTLLLPTLLVAPAERDIRIITLVNPFYAAAVPHFPNPPINKGSQLLREGYRALRTVVLTRHLQRVFDALPQAPAPDPDSASASAASTRVQKSNIVAISVSPGFSRHDIVAPILRADFKRSDFSWIGFLLYILILPLLLVFAKSPSHAIQSILHALFLPTPFKFATMTKEAESQSSSGIESEEILKPGALYSDCSVVKVNLSNRIPAPKEQKPEEKIENNDKRTDGGEYGGEELGRFVWEYYEASLKKEEEKLKNSPSSSTKSSDKKND